MGPFNGPTIAILVILAILLFGAKKLPDLARSLGRSARILKAESKGLVDDDNEAKDSDEAAAQGEQPQDQQSASSQPQQPGANNQQPGYPQLPAGQRLVNESGEPTNQTYNN